MSIYAISDLHLSFNTNKPMDLFGWNDYENEIKENWKKTITDDDLVILSGDFSWEMELKNTYKDFNFINNLPGKKILLKGNHDYWWSSLLKMRQFIKDSNFKNIDFLYNNSYEFDNRIIVGTRGWTLLQDDEETKKIIDRECIRLELSIQDGIKKYGTDKEIIVCMHYPPLTKDNLNNQFVEILKKYNINTCIYGHLHGTATTDAIEGKINKINYILTSCDYTKFKLIKIK